MVTLISKTFGALFALLLFSNRAIACVPDAQTLCLDEGRFAVSID